MSACADNEFRIGLLVRGELDAEEEALLRAHSSECAACASTLAAEERLSRELDKLPRLTAPAELRAQIEAKMRQAPAAAPALRVVSRRWAVAGIAALALLVAAGVTVLVRSRAVRDPLTLAARQAVAERDSLDRQRDLFPTETAGAPALLRELSQRYRLPATTAFPGDDELRLVSVRPGTALGKVSAILVYLDQTIPEPVLMPRDPFDGAHVRAMAMTVACDIHPLNNLRVLKYLKGELGHSQDEADRWYAHWISEGLPALEAMAKAGAGRFLFGDEPTIADICLIPQLFNARRFNVPLDDYPTLLRADESARRLEAFAAAHPDRQEVPA